MPESFQKPEQPHSPAIGHFPELLHTVGRLRLVRDERLYLRDGFHSFREWTMACFGEKLGAWVEETI